MPRRAVPLVAGEYYHLYNRGNNRAAIFLESESYAFFLHQVREYIAPAHALVIAYVLMPNHYHLLVHAQSDELSHALQLFGISYTKAINKRFARVGALFQGAFKAKQVDRDEYLLHLSRYIHLNPLRARLVPQAAQWPYSSYPEFIGIRTGTLPQPTIVLRQFQTSEVSETSEVSLAARHRYREFVESYVADNRRVIAHLLFR